MASPPPPVGVYEPFVRHGELVAISGISSARDGVLITGKVGHDLGLVQAQEAARRAAENLLAVLIEAAGGDEAAIRQVLIVRGQVNASDDFAQVHKVIDAASELLIERLGDRGRHARTAIGCATLPNNNAVTLEALAIVAYPSAQS
ncbi:RidA family protein [Sphingomonas sp.]|uniref:RidA family protein n=1 Tax=Sphingomonas sp. TaxID=28214 RepID=UPI0025E76C49|nr:RidA family protein [Sphingomonas sp.]